MRRVVVLLLISAFVFAEAAPTVEAATKKGKGRSEYTAEQRKKMLEEAWRICRKKYGLVERVRIDYIYNRFYCYTY